MPKPHRRDVLCSGLAMAIPAGILTSIAGCNPPGADSTQEPITDPETESAAENVESEPSKTKSAMKVHYLEIVTPEMDALCEQYASHGTEFSEPVANLGGARTATLESGTLLGIRKPMHDAESPVVRPYVLVEDIQATVDAMEKAGGKVAVPPMPIPEHGTCAIVFQGGIECGFWQL